MAYLGAGPVENLLIQPPAWVVDQVDGAARTHERFRTALRCAWFEEQLAPDDARRLRRFEPPL